MTFFYAAASFIGQFLQCVLSLLPIINPLGVVPLFLALLGGKPEDERRLMAWRVSRNAVIVMFVSLFFGGAILSFFSISIGSLTVSGGLVLAYLGFRLLFPDESALPVSPDTAGRDPSFVPLAFPGLTGAGTMAMVMGWSEQLAFRGTVLTGIVTVLAMCTAFLALGFISFMVLSEAHRVTKLLGEQGINGLTRIMGLLMVCLGVELIARGIRDIMVLMS